MCLGLGLVGSIGFGFRVQCFWVTVGGDVFVKCNDLFLASKGPPLFEAGTQRFRACGFRV